MAKIRQVHKTGIGNSAVSINVDAVDNQGIVALNGVQLAQLDGPGDFRGYRENITRQLNYGVNVLVISVVNYGGVAHISGSVDVGPNEINIGETSGGSSAPDGMYSQIVIVLEK